MTKSLSHKIGLTALVFAALAALACSGTAQTPAVAPVADTIVALDRTVEAHANGVEVSWTDQGPESAVEEHAAPVTKLPLAAMEGRTTRNGRLAVRR